MTTVSEFLVHEELNDLDEIAKVHKWILERLDSKSFLIGFTASNGDLYWCKVICEGYKILPPRWHWYNRKTKSIDDPNCIPKVYGMEVRNYFHPAGFICAPWNQLAYMFVGPKGLHSDWKLTEWQSNRHTRGCVTLSSMAIQIHQELRNQVKRS